MAADSRLGGRPRTRLVAQVRARHQPCAMCGLPIDQTLNRVGRRHPLASVVDEWYPRNPKHGGPGGPVSAANCVEMHDRCNSIKSNHWPITPALHTRARQAVLELHGHVQPDIERTW